MGSEMCIRDSIINKHRILLRRVDDGSTMGGGDVMNDFANTKATDDVAFVTTPDADSMTPSADMSPVDVVTRVYADCIVPFDVAGRKQTKPSFASTLSHLPDDHVAWKVLGQHASKEILHIPRGSAVAGRSGLEGLDKDHKGTHV